MEVIILKETRKGFVCEHITNVFTENAKKTTATGRGKREAFRKCFHKVKKATKK